MKVGLDVGSTTIKCVVLDDADNLVYSTYERHYSHILEKSEELLRRVADQHGAKADLAISGSAGMGMAESVQVPFVQEVFATRVAANKLAPGTDCIIELGGEDAKILFLTGGMEVRMNGSCAGGTGAFIDQMATLLKMSADEMDAAAQRAEKTYTIASRCGVFAKSDVQPLINQGAKAEDISASIYQAVVNQTIAGLAQGRPIKGSVLYLGGPLTFSRVLRESFDHTLGVQGTCPENSLLYVALGAAFYSDQEFDLNQVADDLQKHGSAETYRSLPPLFSSREEYEAFRARHAKATVPQVPFGADYAAPVHIGIDSGSTTSKCVFIDENEQVTDTFYANNQGEPLKVVREGLLALAEKYEKMGIQLEVLGLGTTGYGEQMLSSAFHADYHTVETVAHARGCRRFFPDATFLLDIGGQDMKAIWLKDGVVTNIMLNEACSSGCGSFLENFAATLGMPVDQVADAAFRSQAPAELGSRCTVFMNSTIINEQRNGKQPDDLMAGLCRSIIENVFTKVVRIANVAELGDRVVVQGGTFRNFAVLWALEEYLGRDVTLAPYPGEMGALGAALAVKQEVEAHGYANGRCSAFIGFDAVKNFQYTRESGVLCPHCTNHCSRTILHFPDGGCYVTGNRCDRGAVVMEAAPAHKAQEVPDLFRLRQELLFKTYPVSPVREEQSQTVGLPRVLEFWDSMPFWSTFFRALGYRVKFSHPSSRRQYESGLQYVASDTICFPAKLVHGHVLDLSKQGVDRIFLPYILHMPTENKGEKSPYVCPVIMGYSMVVRNFQSPGEHFSVGFETPVFHWFSKQDRKRQICRYAVEHCGATKRQAEAAYRQAETAILSFRHQLVEEGKRVIADTGKAGGFAVVLAGRPYHTDPLINHDLSGMFTRRGIPVLTVDSLPGLEKADLRRSRGDHQ